MQLKNLALLTAALSTTASAEFVIITNVPTPTAIPDLSNIRSYISSLENFVTSKIGDLTKSLSPSQISQANSARTALANFVATATYDIPQEVTQLSALETYTTIPAWYSALPSDVRSYYDANNARVQSLVNEAILGTNASAGASASAATTGSKPQSTGAAPRGVVQVMGAGVAAAVVGVLAL